MQVDDLKRGNPMDKEHLDKARRRLLDEIRDEAYETRNFTGRAEFAQSVMDAMAAVPRHEFVAPGDEAVAYINRPQPIGHGQTISQPYIVAVMTDLLDVRPGDRVLEIGTGCGYQAAVLAQVGARVYSMEAVEALAHVTVLCLGKTSGLTGVNVELELVEPPDDAAEANDAAKANDAAEAH